MTNLCSINEPHRSSVVRGTGQVQLKFYNNAPFQKSYRNDDKHRDNFLFKPPRSIHIRIHRHPSGPHDISEEHKVYTGFERRNNNNLNMQPKQHRIFSIFDGNNAFRKLRHPSSLIRQTLCSIVLGGHASKIIPHNLPDNHFAWTYNVKAPWLGEHKPKNERIIPIVAKRYISHFSSDSVEKHSTTPLITKQASAPPAQHKDKSVCSTRTIQLPLKSSSAEPTTIRSFGRVATNSPSTTTTNVLNADFDGPLPVKSVEPRNSAKTKSVSSLVNNFVELAKNKSSSDQRVHQHPAVSDAKRIITTTGSVNSCERPPKRHSSCSLFLKKDPQIISSAVNIDAETSECSIAVEEHIPTFYFPNGQTSAEFRFKEEQKLTNLKQMFDKKESQCIGFNDFSDVMRVLDLPLYWKSALFRAIGIRKKDAISFDAVSNVWKNIVSNFHDPASRFFYLLSCNRNQNYLEPCDWENFILDVVNTHPGLRFLKEAREFISRYCKTVIARIYFVVNRTLSDRITLNELRNSNLLQVIDNLEKEDDINKFTDYFSYEHFYVIYCKFWEIDTDHDLFISREDLYQHNQNAISRRVIDRIFSGAVTNCADIRKGLMSYYEFVWFLIAEEDKHSRSSIEYWFRCLDIDGDGYISMYELEYFYEEQMQRMEMYGFEFMQFEDVMCQILDMLKPVDNTKIRLMDLKKCKLVNVFFDTFINTEKHLENEQRDPFARFK
ncbi:hypothetical protein GJ496_003026, partial [Pomphorhynchus laevis]